MSSLAARTATFSPAIVALRSQQRNAPENLQAHPSFINLLSGKCAGASCVAALVRDWCGGVCVKGQQERPQRWAFEMSYEFRLPGSHRLCASAAVQRHSATLSRQDWWVDFIHSISLFFVWNENTRGSNLHRYDSAPESYTGSVEQVRLWFARSQSCRVFFSFF